MCRGCSRLPPLGGGLPRAEPPTIARGVGSRAFPETFPSSLDRRRPPPGARSWARPSPAGGRRARLGPPRRNRTGEGDARGGSARGGGQRGEAARRSPARGRRGHRARRSRDSHGGGAQPRARALELGLPGPLLRPPPCLHLLRPVDLRLFLLDRRPRAVMGTGAGRRRGGDRGGRWGAMGHCPLLTRACKPRGKGAEREDAGGSTIAGSSGTFCCRLKSDYFFPDSTHKEAGLGASRRRLGGAVDGAVDRKQPVLGSSVSLSPFTSHVSWASYKSSRKWG